VNAISAQEARQQVQAALDTLESVASPGGALQIHADDRAALAQAIERSRAQLTSSSDDDVLSIALVGGTGAGKSTLISALAGAKIAGFSDVRPCTKVPMVYHPRAIKVGGLPASLTERATFVAHDRGELSRRVLIDTPDLDSFVREHRQITLDTIKAVGLILFVVSQEKYLDHAGWSVIRAEQKFAPCAVVLNRIDQVGSAAEVERVVADIKLRFAQLGRPDVRVFKLCAHQHIVGAERKIADDYDALRDFIEREMDASAVRQLRSAQRQRVVANLGKQLRVALPESLEASLASLPAKAIEQATICTDQIAIDWKASLHTTAEELRPLATLRTHQQFWGPMRLWLAASDFLTIGLPRLMKRGLTFFRAGEKPLALLTLESADARQSDARLAASASALQNHLFAEKLPVQRWQSIATAPTTFRDDVGTELMRLEASRPVYFSGPLVHVVSGFCTALALTLVGYGLYRMIADLRVGQYQGQYLLLHLLAILAVSFALIHGVMHVLTLHLRSRDDLTRSAIAASVRKTLNDWIDRYRGAIETDLKSARTALATLTEIVGSDDSPEPAPAPLDVAAQRTEPESTPPAPAFAPEPEAIDLQLKKRLGKA
jgi:GTPase Era involved in 16S rRNA processing